MESLFLSGSRYDVAFGWFHDAPAEGVREIVLDCDGLNMFLERAHTLLRSPRLVRLSSLSLTDGQYHSGHLAGLGDVDAVSRLKSLTINSGVFTADDFTALLASPRIAGLEEFSVLGTNLGDFGAFTLARCPHLAGLKRLVYHDHLITSSGNAALANSPFLCEAIRARWRRPTDEGGMNR